MCERWPRGCISVIIAVRPCETTSKSHQRQVIVYRNDLAVIEVIFSDHIVCNFM